MPAVTYTFFGRVHPERANVTISPPTQFRFAQADSAIVGSLAVAIDLSQVVATFASETVVENICTFRNYVLDAVRAELDILGFVKGAGYDLDLIEVTDSEGRRPEVLGVGIPALEAVRPTAHFTEILEVFADERGHYLGRCLADLREAIREPRDTGLFLYRGIESLMQYFLGFVPDRDKRTAWTLLRHELDVSESLARELASAAKAPRHGEAQHLEDAHRARLFSETWRIIDRYIAYARRGYSNRS